VQIYVVDSPDSSSSFECPYPFIPPRFPIVCVFHARGFNTPVYFNPTLLQIVSSNNASVRFLSSRPSHNFEVEIVADQPLSTYNLTVLFNSTVPLTWTIFHTTSLVDVTSSLRCDPAVSDQLVTCATVARYEDSDVPVTLLSFSPTISPPCNVCASATDIVFKPISSSVPDPSVLIEDFELAFNVNGSGYLTVSDGVSAPLVLEIAQTPDSSSLIECPEVVRPFVFFMRHCYIFFYVCTVFAGFICPC